MTADNEYVTMNKCNTGTLQEHKTPFR